MWFNVSTKKFQISFTCFDHLIRNTSIARNIKKRLNVSNMFKNLTNFGYQRNFKEAVGFYVAYLLFNAIIAAIVGATVSLTKTGSFFNFGISVGSTVAIINCFGLSLLISKEKGLLGNLGVIMLVILSGLLAMFAGGLGGLIPTTYLSTRPTKR